MIKDLKLTKECLTEEGKGRGLTQRSALKGVPVIVNQAPRDEAHILLAIYMPLPPLLNCGMLRNSTAGSQRQHCSLFGDHTQDLYHGRCYCSCCNSWSLQHHCRTCTPASTVRCESHLITECSPPGWRAFTITYLLNVLCKEYL